MEEWRLDRRAVWRVVSKRPPLGVPDCGRGGRRAAPADRGIRGVHRVPLLDRAEEDTAQVVGVVRSMADHRIARVKVVFDPGRTSAAEVQTRIAQAGYEVVP